MGLDRNVFLVLEAGTWPTVLYGLCFLEQSPWLNSLSALYIQLHVACGHTRLEHKTRGNLE